ncbi:MULTISPECIES: cation:proton antiporter [unclassified Pseudoxanthomonas]|uniref:cation:proton antiporter n=1 Tax=unclassified Pseudoxanthomonas TaxID=2645906 RepID=UPI0008F4489C|nr:MULTISPECIES: cation:proton antiporter [unclassified Pseudoxanthomonas]PPJ41096.1 cation/H(+) antiporter [Pseudoxanthomonas sp. KAs_5_3]SFV31263.1 transporter, CPA2 family [Pseudoxanthomonas sp. YR558]
MSTPQLSVYFFLQAGLIILACRLVGKLAQRIGQPQVVGEMIAGVMLGPSLFGAVLPDAQAALFPKDTLDMLYVGGQVGVGMYMFLVGTEFQADHIRTRYRSAMAVSWAGIAVPFVLAFALAPWLQHVPGLFADTARFLEVALFLGAAIAITAFPMLARIIHERGLAGTPLGTLALTAGAMDDAAAWCILAIVLASFGGSWNQAWLAIGGGIAYVAFMLLAGRRLLTPLAAQVPAEGPLPTPVFAWVMAAFFLCAWAMDAIGIHAVFGGFILGICLPRGALTERLRERLQGMVVVVLLPLFFTYSGLKTQLSVLLDPAILVPAIAILLASFGGKAIACWAAARLSGESPRDAKAIGALMNARGLMELIIINIGLQAGLIKPGLFTILVIMAILSTLMATPLFNRIMRERNAPAAPAPGASPG